MNDLPLEEFLDMVDEDKATYLRDRMMPIVEPTSYKFTTLPPRNRVAASLP